MTIAEKQKKKSSQKQVSIRLDDNIQREFKKKLSTDNLSQQEFLNFIIQQYLADNISVSKSLDIRFHPSDLEYLKTIAGDGYEADSLEELRDMVEGRKPLRKIKRKK
ncbi:MAG TPA: hypothetical protein VGB30_06760 [bacterium]|jgi:hypothetical protein